MNWALSPIIDNYLADNDETNYRFFHFDWINRNRLRVERVGTV